MYPSPSSSPPWRVLAYFNHYSPKAVSYPCPIAVVHVDAVQFHQYPPPTHKSCFSRLLGSMQYCIMIISDLYWTSLVSFLPEKTVHFFFLLCFYSHLNSYWCMKAFTLSTASSSYSILWCITLFYIDFLNLLQLCLSINSIIWYSLYLFFPLFISFFLYNSF